MFDTHLDHRAARIAAFTAGSRSNHASRAHAAHEHVQKGLETVESLIKSGELPAAIKQLLGELEYRVIGLDRETHFVRVNMKTSWNHWPVHEKDIPMEWDATMHQKPSIRGRYRWIVPGHGGREEVDVQLTGPATSKEAQRELLQK